MENVDTMGEYIDPETYFKRLKVDYGRLEKFGFAKTADGWEYSEGVADGALCCSIRIDGGGAVGESVIDSATGDEYVQHRVEGAAGKFVGRVRRDVMGIMERIREGCFSRDVYKTALAHRMLAFAEAEWGERPEFMWKQFPDYAILRRKDTGKWYAILARIPACKLGGGADGTAEIVNLKRTEGMEGDVFLPAWHMNKKTWTTLRLDGKIGEGEFMRFLEASRQSAR